MAGPNRGKAGFAEELQSAEGMEEEKINRNGPKSVLPYFA